MPDKNPLPAGLRNQVDEFLIPQQVGADLRHPRQLCARRDNVPQQRFRALHIDGEIVVDEGKRPLFRGAAARTPSIAAFRPPRSDWTENGSRSPKNPVTVQNSHP